MITQKHYGINDFPTKFAELRSERNLKQKEFADFLGIATGAVGGYENGSRMPNAKQIIKICEKCNVSADYLLRADTSVKSPDTTIQAVCKYTGLSEKAIEFLHNSRDAEGKTIYPILNIILNATADYNAERGIQ